MSRLGAGLAPYLELSRLSNLPTVWTNAMVGFAIGGWGGRGEVPPLCVMTQMTVAVSLLYVAGMALNDVVDARVDRAERPDRPIPSGRVSIVGAVALVAVCMAAGLTLMALLGAWPARLGLVLAATIVLYDAVHKWTGASVLLMGACRGLVYPTAAAAIAWPVDPVVTWTLAGAMASYIVVLTFVARREAGPGNVRRRALWPLLPITALGPVVVLGAPDGAWPAVVAAGVIAAGWLVFASRHLWARPPRMKCAVLGWLSGICLVDALFLVLLDQPGLAGAAAACFVLTAIGHRYILGT